MDKTEEKEMAKKRPFAKDTWYNWLANFIPKPTKNGSQY